MIFGSLLYVHDANAATPIGVAEMCFGLPTFDGTDDGLRLGRVTGTARAEMFVVLPSSCERAPEDCSGLPKSYADPGDIVVVGQEVSGFVCVHRPGGTSETNGWLSFDRVKIEDPKKIAVPVGSWLGTWRGISTDATIVLRSFDNEALHAEGEAWWPSAANARRSGAFDATAIPAGSTAAFVEEGGVRSWVPSVSSSAWSSAFGPRQ